MILLTVIEKIVEYKREQVPNDLAKGLVDLAVSEMIREKVRLCNTHVTFLMLKCVILGSGTGLARSSIASAGSSVAQW